MDFNFRLVTGKALFRFNAAFLALSPKKAMEEAIAQVNVGFPINTAGLQ